MSSRSVADQNVIMWYLILFCYSSSGGLTYHGRWHVGFRNEAVNLLGGERHYSAYHMAFKNLAFLYFPMRRIGRRSRKVFGNNAPWVFQVSAHLESRSAWCLCSRVYSQECLYSKQLRNMEIVFTSGAKIVSFVCFVSLIGKCLPPRQKAGFPSITKDSGS